MYYLITFILEVVGLILFLKIIGFISCLYDEAEDELEDHEQ